MQGTPWRQSVGSIVLALALLGCGGDEESTLTGTWTGTIQDSIADTGAILPLPWCCPQYCVPGIETDGECTSAPRGAYAWRYGMPRPRALAVRPKGNHLLRLIGNPYLGAPGNVLDEAAEHPT